LAEAPKVKTTITVVRLDGNSIGDAGCTALAEALKVDTAVSKIYR
jgi:hypothetical protein